MHTLANCTVTQRRPTGGKTQFGDPDGSMTTLTTGLVMSITEKSKRTWDGATQTPRTVRVLTGTVAAGTDMRKGDQLQDEQTGRKYVVKDVTQGLVFGYTPDLEVDLARVGSGE